MESCIRCVRDNSLDSAGYLAPDIFFQAQRLLKIG